MGFFRKTLGLRDKQEPAPQEGGAGAGAGRQPAAGPAGGAAAAARSAFSPAISNNDDDDFDDAASYHSITSNPGAVRPARTLPRDGAFAQAQSPLYASLPSHGRSGVRSIADGHYGGPGDGHSPRSLGAAANPSRTEQQPRGARPAETPLRSPADSGQAFAPAPRGMPPSDRPMSAQELGVEYFQKAVGFHEEGDLVSATGYFKRAADKQNPLGMLFYGLSLRHGWGCQPNEHMAFVYLQKAGEIVVPHVKDMDPAVAGMAREELAMAIYELGQSYRHGWGVSRNKKTAAYYFEVAADLGDADAQADVAACYEKGDGVKRNMKRAAHYYRQAHRQGVELFGTSWIFKNKYDSD
ncbi:hypothetical protein LPJ61_003839 [Coemansia biformis]|uniref:HCP-like protein n=1 Tax=Coemansia biformis TaxID=1286918 RepID=A0A9W7Y9S9_9FUNG|nr:hypothetical protein LPJ61_003839 [Coemansia biformis]